MPELAEVETLKRYLVSHIIGDKITNYTQRRNSLRYELTKDLFNYLINTTIIDLTRRAKYLNIYLDNDYVLTFHLGMSGRITIQQENYHLQKHDHVIIEFQSGKQLVFNDARRFGMVYISPSNEVSNQHYFKALGVEPLGEKFDTEYLLKKLLNKKIAVKLAIMDNKIVVGVGNIYAAESLFRAQINPLTPSNTLTKEEVCSIVSSIKQVLEKAIQAGGTTLRDFVGPDGKPGYFKQELNVYGRQGLSCYICQYKIEKIKQSGRSTFFCPHCQTDC
ncbi:MAG: bifunctional DNA-formamidopyrimidine glycosylase/DNA-(apurinic or apyrimidinic site) lyase [Rickettsiaceae bacterium]|jgi:formamidopyrimidine-DNA glycosylase|nr:bifunctional DNA-formamidopyrimidine glycosylase/DNA-(apurinic or apyrimidinic site) lyase [Rickettsiaceae bacterium]